MCAPGLLLPGLVFPRRSLLFTLLIICSLSAFAQKSSPEPSLRERLHQSDQWLEIQKHLPDPATATPLRLEQQADILRARRFPEDALDYYKYAMDRGGDSAALFNKMGLTHLEMRNNELARAYFHRALKINKKNPDAWNNLGAVEFMDGDTHRAVSDYKKAIKANKHQAVFHANLATAYFAEKSYTNARREIATALSLDPQVFKQELGFGGVAAHVLSAEDRARFSFEMAKLYAQTGDVEQMMHSLAMASEAGMDVQHEMHRDPVLAKFENDPRVLVIVHNARAVRTGVGTISESDPAPVLPGSTGPL